MRTELSASRAGRMLEVFVYHEAKKSAKFDDVASSFDLIWGKDYRKNELDCVITKGFCTAVIECKAMYELTQEIYHNFAEVSRNFGINAKRIFITDMGGHEDSRNNQRCREFGQQLHIETIYRPADLHDIVRALMNILTAG